MATTQKNANSKPETVVVFGGGLAGLIAARELVRMGVGVDLYERDGHLGGKAASYLPSVVYDGSLNEISNKKKCVARDVRSDHGYHVFPKWYVNMRRLWEELDKDFEKKYVVEGKDYYRLQPGDHYDFQPPLDPSLVKKLCILDLIRQPDEVVDDITCRGFFFSRPYNPKDSVSLDDLFLNALSIAEYDISARVARDLFRQWYPMYHLPNWDALKGDLNEMLIDKIEDSIKALAAQNNVSFNVYKNHSLTNISPVGGIVVYSIKNTKTNDEIKVERAKLGPVVMAIPFNDLLTMRDDELHEAEPALSKTKRLRANQYPGLDIYFKNKIENMPFEHFDLEGSIYNLSAYDISQHWTSFKKGPLVDYKGTVLQFVAGNCKELEGLSEHKILSELMAEIRRFIPDASKDGIEYIVFHANTKLPLFVNDVDTWRKRPKSEGKWFYYAGDYTRHITDITSMEGAVRSGLNAAEAIRAEHYPNKPPVHIEEPIGIKADKYKEIETNINTLLAELIKMNKLIESVKIEPK